MDELFRLGPVDPHLKSQFFLRREPVFVVPPALVTSRRILLIRSPRHFVVRLQQTLREVGKQHAFARRRRLRSHHYWSAVSPRFRSCISDLPFPLPRRALALLFPVCACHSIGRHRRRKVSRSAHRRHQRLQIQHAPLSSGSVHQLAFQHRSGPHLRRPLSRAPRSCFVHPRQQVLDLAFEHDRVQGAVPERPLTRRHNRQPLQRVRQL